MAVTISFGSISAAKTKTVKKPKLAKTQIDSVSYAAGVVLGVDLQKMMVNNFDNKLKTKTFLQGFNTIVNGDSTFLSNEKALDMLQTYMKKAQAEKDSTWKVANDKFLADNAKKEGVVTLPDGLQYKIITPGTGEKPVATDTVTVNYEGSLIDGRVFDSSYRRGQAADFPLNRVIKGFSEGFAQLAPGSKAVLYIPSELGYGVRGAGDGIPGNSALIFNVELISIKHATAQPAAVITSPAVDSTVTVAPAPKNNKAAKAQRKTNKKK